MAALALACPGGGFSVPEKKAGGWLLRKGKGENGMSMNWNRLCRKKCRAVGCMARTKGRGMDVGAFHHSAIKPESRQSGGHGKRGALYKRAENGRLLWLRIAC